MKIYYFTPVTSHIEELIALDITPKKYGTIGEHLAYAITAAEKFAKKIHANAYSKTVLNNAIKKVFVKHMQKTLLTHILLKKVSLDAIDFTVKDLSSTLAKLFMLDNPASQLVTDERVEKHIPECPIYLTPIKYGIKFRGDPNWYDINAAYQAIFELHANRDPLSPCTKEIWLGVEGTYKFLVDNTADEAASDRRADLQLHAINERLRVVYANIPQDWPQQHRARLPENFNLAPPQQEYFFNSGMATIRRFAQQNLTLDIVPYLMALGTTSMSNSQQILRMIEMLRIMDGNRESDIVTTALIVATVIPNFLIKYSFQYVTMSYALKFIRNILSPENDNQNIQPNRDERMQMLENAAQLGDLSALFLYPIHLEPQQQEANEALPQNLNPNGWSVSSMIQRLGFLAPSRAAVAEALARFQNPMEVGHELARRWGLR